MKLADFFIGSRQLFGFLAPGLVWLLVIYVAIGRSTVLEALSKAEALEILAFLGLALVVGTAVETISFRIAVRASASLRGDRVSREADDSDYFPLSLPRDLISHCRELAVRRSNVPEAIRGMSDRQLSQYCKYSVIERTEELRSRLIEYESEINLLAMLPLPLVLFSVSNLLSALRPEVLMPLSLRLLMSLVALLVALLMLFRLHPLRREEAEAWFRFFLLAADVERAESAG